MSEVVDLTVVESRPNLAGGSMFTANEVPYSAIIDQELCPIPEKTDSYQPLSNAQQIGIVRRAMEARGFSLIQQRYGLSCKGKRMVFLQAWDHPDLPKDRDMHLFTGGLNSYDKSVAAKLGLGGSLFVCENLQMAAEIELHRRHTLNVIDDFEYLVEVAADKALPMFLDLTDDMERLKKVKIDQVGGYHLLGEALGAWGTEDEFLSPQQVNAACKAWKKPLHESFADRNLFSWYQAANEALKKSPAHAMMDRLSALHRFAQKVAVDVDSPLMITQQ